jgi:hypothetical protein
MPIVKRTLQQLVIEEIDRMGFTYDLENDERYKMGIQEGMRLGMQQIARESLLNGGTVEFTAKVTGLSLKQVREIKSRLDSE